MSKDLGKEAFFHYVGRPDELRGYNKSYKLVFYKYFFENAGDDGRVEADILVHCFHQFYLKRALSGLPAEDGADSVIQDIEKSTFDDVYGIVMKDPVRYISQKGFIYVRESGSKKFFEIAPYLWSELTRDDVKYILDVVEHKLELYFLRRVNKEEKITHHNKLVRDLIPDIINASGRICEIEFLEQRVYMEELRLKLQEEVAEYLNDSNLEELADVLEVLHALTKAHGCSWEELERVRAEKKSSRGGFEKKIFLKSVKQI